MINVINFFFNITILFLLLLAIVLTLSAGSLIVMFTIQTVKDLINKHKR